MSYVPELRALLVRAAELRGAARAAGPPGPAPRRRRWFGEFGTAVAAGVAVAIVFVGHVRQGASNGGVGAPGAHLTVPPPPPPPNPTSGQWSLIVGARRATAARDRACSPFVTVPRLSPGAPGPALTSILGVLRRPPSAADSIPREFFQPLRGIYLAAIRRARYVDGVGLYVVPTANLFGWRPVPARCRSEEAAALQREARSSGALQVAAALDVQRRYLNWQQYEARHPEGICVAELDPRGAVGEACGWGVGEIEQGLAGLGGTDIPGPGLFHGIVPDGVTSVTLELTRGRAAVDARVVNNMYLARLPHGVNMPTRILWRAADGRVLKTTRMP